MIELQKKKFIEKMKKGERIFVRLGVKQTNQNIQTPEEAKLAGLRNCFRELGDLKFAALLFVTSCLLKTWSCNLYRAADFSANETGFRGNYGRLLRFFSTGLGEAPGRNCHGCPRTALRDLCHQRSPRRNPSTRIVTKTKFEKICKRDRLQG